MLEGMALFSLAFLIYTYFGYPFFLWIIGRVRNFVPVVGTIHPTVSVVLSARNEEKCLGETIQSILASDYPKEKLELIVVSDCSTDNTERVARSFQDSRMRLLVKSTREGRVAALRWGLSDAQGEIIIKTDASSVFLPETVQRLVRHFADPRVGACIGRKTIVASGSSVSSGDGLYWKYESWLRTWESRTGSCLVGCEGGLYAVRKKLYHLHFPTQISDDYAVSCDLYEQGATIVYDRTAVVRESATLNMALEFSRKIRVIVRGILSFWAFKHLLRPGRHRLFFFQNISHRLCRWLAPFFLIALLVSSGLSLREEWRVLFYLQVLFYGSGLLGMLLKPWRKIPRVASVPMYFTTVNAAALVSWFLLKKDFSTFTTTVREEWRQT